MLKSVSSRKSTRKSTRKLRRVSARKSRKLSKRKSVRKSLRKSRRISRKSKRISRRSINNGCVKQTTSKYLKRSSPPYPANKCCGQELLGNDKNMYITNKNKNGVCRWVRKYRVQ